MLGGLESDAVTVLKQVSTNRSNAKASLDRLLGIDAH